MITTWLPLNFFSSSRTRRIWILWNAFSSLKGTVMMIAFLSAAGGPTGTSTAETMYRSRSSALISDADISRLKSSVPTLFSKSDG